MPLQPFELGLDRFELASRRIEQTSNRQGTTLDLAKFGLKRLPKTLFLLKGIKALDLTGNQLEELPPNLGSLSELESLWLDGSSLNALPVSMGGLTRLKGLFLAYNRFSSFPEVILQLKELEILSLDGNLIDVLPEHLDRLSRLSQLSLKGNSIKTLPPSLRRMLNLEKLELEGNGALGIPREILSAGAQQLIRYYFRTRETGDDKQLREAKMIFLGRGGVGKTSLAMQLIHGTFSPHSAITSGIEISDWKIKVSDGDVHMHLWDFGGQEIMHATHQFFLTDRSLYIVVLSGREGREDEDAEYWLRTVGLFAPRSKILLVCNKCKSFPVDIDKIGLRDRFPALSAIIDTDCERGFGIDDLAGAIRNAVDGMESVRALFPAEWIAIKDRMAGDNRDFISFAEFRRLCALHGEESLSSQTELAKYLHLLGIALHYGDDSRLQETSVLNPSWVTEGVYKILLAPRGTGDTGIINRSALAAILPEERFPSSQHSFLLSLMERFDLCFPLFSHQSGDPDTVASVLGVSVSGEYLVPERLPNTRPESNALSRGHPDCFLRYVYPVVFEGIIPKMIVRARSLCIDGLWWRNGVALTKGVALAIVESSRYDREVTVSLFGPTKDRALLLDSIRGHFERLHSEYEGLGVAEEIAMDAASRIGWVSVSSLIEAGKHGIKCLQLASRTGLIQVDVEKVLHELGYVSESQVSDGRGGLEGGGLVLGD